MATFWGKVANWQPFVKEAKTHIKNKTDVSESAYMWSLKVCLTQASKKTIFSLSFSCGFVTFHF